MTIVEVPVETPVEAPVKWVCPEKTRELLLKVRDHILEDSARLDMGEWGGDCKTAACIAGWSVRLSGLRIQSGSVSRAAREALSISVAQSQSLFFAAPLADYAITGWPDPFRSAYKNAIDGGVRAEIAAARIMHFIETGE